MCWSCCSVSDVVGQQEGSIKWDRRWLVLARSDTQPLFAHFVSVLIIVSFMFRSSCCLCIAPTPASGPSMPLTFSMCRLAATATRSFAFWARRVFAFRFDTKVIHNNQLFLFMSLSLRSFVPISVFVLAYNGPSAMIGLRSSSYARKTSPRSWSPSRSAPLTWPPPAQPQPPTSRLLRCVLVSVGMSCAYKSRLRVCRAVAVPPRRRQRAFAPPSLSWPRPQRPHRSKW